MARDYKSHEEGETYETCEDEDGERYRNKRFDLFNIHDACISKEHDMPWLLSYFGKGDHRFQKFQLYEFSVLDN